MRAVILGVTVGINAIAISTQRAVSDDECQRNDTRLIHSLRGYNSIGLDFKYESRVEKDTSYSHRYIWCIENRSDNIADFQWGTKEKPNLYFGASVRPGQSKPNIAASSSGLETNPRIIAFRAQGGNDYPPITPETVHYRQTLLHNSDLSDAPRFKLVQADLESILTEYQN